MIERESRLFKKEIDNPKLKAQFHQEIYEGLALDEAAFLKIPPEIEKGIVVNIASELATLSEYLDIPLPEIGLTKYWNDKSEDRLRSFSISDILASAIVDDEHPYGIIRYSPFYLKSYITNQIRLKEGLDTHLSLPLSAINGHEAFHLWQYKNNNSHVVDDVKVLENEGLDLWNQTQTEIQAREFEKRWLERVFISF